MRLLGCAAIGLALFAGGLTFLTYGIAQAVENGNCGTDEYGRSLGPACPEGFGPMIVLMILGAFVALGGATLFSARERGSGPLVIFEGMGRFFGVALPAAGVAVVLGLIDVKAGDTRPGREIVAIAAGLVLLVSLPGLLRGRRKPAAEARSAAPQPAVNAALRVQLSDLLGAVHAARAADGSGAAATPPDGPALRADAAARAPSSSASSPQARAEEIAERLRQLDQLRETGIMSDDEYADRRRQILSEL